MSIASPAELEGMCAAGAVVHKVIEAMRQQVRPGVSTAELDDMGDQVMKGEGARSAPALVYGFPGSSCISVNEEAVHGVPGERPLRDGDLVKLDVTVEKNGFMADAAITVVTGRASAESRSLIACAERAFQKALLVARAGFRIFEIGRVVEREVRRSGFSVIRDLAGHGIGRTIHEPPTVPNYPDPMASQLLEEGMVITIEPIIGAGGSRVVTTRNGWTISTADRRYTAHYEHTVVITRGRPLILTAGNAAVA